MSMQRLDTNVLVTLFILAQNRNQPKCPSVGEWFNKLWYIRTMEHDSAMKNNGLLAHTMT